MRRLFSRAAMIAAASLLLAAPAAAQSCQGGKSFEAWLRDFKAQAIQSGISPRAASAALDGLSFDRDVVRRDRAQGVFAQDFVQFSSRMVARYRLEKGAALIKKDAGIFRRVEQQFGVPAPVLVAFWGLETDFGANLGDSNTLRSVATLAYDCRRPDMFRTELMSALRLVDRGDLSPQEMRGPWAGELGQFQFLPSHYLNYGVDFDGDGHINLIRSDADALASAANYLTSLGWRRGEPWLQEVRVPGNLPWQEADLAIQHPRSYWVNLGVKPTGKADLPADNLPASLLLPMGKDGPAFLAYPNFQVYLKWNQSLVYSTTAAYFATRLAGAPPLDPGTARHLSVAQVKTLQQELARRGHDVGKIDGVIGEGTRAAVKQEQIRLGLPADSYPKAELLQQLR